MPYKHEKLASVSTIRLIKLKRKKIDGKIACTICHIEQATKDTLYDALSYVWGDPTPTRSIYIKSTQTSEWHDFQVHENLWKFLNNAWDREVFDRWLWTDRICLDQSHGSQELGEQIPRMAEIYHNAERVVAWLGITDSQARALVPARVALRERRRLVKEHIAKDFSEDTVAAITAVRDAEYWQRLWVVQEFVSAKQIVVVGGNLEFQWDEMNRMLGAELKDNDKAAILQKMRGWTVYHDDVDLWYWLWQITSRDFRSTKPHDLVYGVLGLAITYGSGKSQPNLIRKAYYEEPDGYVIIDALFESLASFYVPTAINLLLRTSSTLDAGVFTTFHGYINSDRTSDRHKRLACILLKICDAFFSVLSLTKPELNWPFGEADFHKIVRVIFFTESSEYVQHNAVLLGLALVFSIYGEVKRRQIFQDWRDIRKIGPGAGGQWKCRNHLPYLPRNRSNAHDPCEEPENFSARKYGPVDLKKGMVFGHAPVSLPNLDPILRQACTSREDSHLACHESIVGFQIPEAGFRLELSLSRDDSPSDLDGKWASAWFWPPEGDIDGTDAVRTNQ